ncbi:MAG: MBL fold metallo-hydrolase [Methanomassiliicoccales archaeon]|nr:MBL fold metallo-hydrolase [Methanomassiliicoccales archaeon]
MTTITFHGGVREVGGNKFLVRSKETSLFLDFGKNYAREKRFYEEPFLRPKDEEHLLSLGIIPRVAGIYKADEDEPTIDGIVLSHAHTDHGDSIRYLKDELPVHCGSVTRQIVLAREFSGLSQGEYPIGKCVKVRGEDCYEQKCFKDFVEIEAGQKHKIGDLNITQYQVDHSTPGACGTILETPDSVIAYTGDLRVHGRRQRLTRSFIDAAKKAKPDVLLIEGTNMLEGRMNDEGDVMSKAVDVANRTKGLVMAGFSNADLDRARTFYEVAKETGRTLVLSAKQAYILHRLRQFKDQDFLSIEDDGVAVFLKSKKRRSPFEIELESEESYRFMEASDVKGMQSEIILAFTLYDMNETFEIKPTSGSSYILSSSEPFDEEMEISYDKLCNWLKHLGMPLYQIHASGHARPYELKEIISEISPEVVMPIHTSCPDLYSNFISDVALRVEIPKDGMVYQIQ